MTRDQERWAEALAIDKWKGEDVYRYIAEQIGKLATAGDEAGVQRFLQIAGRLESLRLASPEN